MLKGVSLTVPRGGIVALLGRQRRRQDHHPQGHLQPAARRARPRVTKGSIELEGERVQGLTPNDLVKRGVIQVMEGRHCFEHLTVEENLLTGAYTRGGDRAGIQRDLEMVYTYFPRLKERRSSQAGYTSGGEQQMTAIGRALMSRPKVVLLDEPSMGLAPQLVEQIFEIVREINEREGVTLLLAEQNTNVALRYARYGYILENGRVVMDGPAERLRENEDVKEFYLGLSAAGRKSYREGQALQATQAVAELGMATDEHFDSLETRNDEQRETALFEALREQVARLKRSAGGWAERLAEIEPAALTGRTSLAALPVTRKHDLIALQKAAPPFGGAQRRRAGRGRAPVHLGRARSSRWRRARAITAAWPRALFAAGLRPGEVVHNCFA